MLPRAYLFLAILALACASAGRLSADSENKALPENASVAKLLEIAREARGKEDRGAEYVAFVAACRKATAEDIKPLKEHLRTCKPGGLVPEEMYMLLVDAWARNSLPKTLSREPGFPEVALPESLAKSPDFLREAASYYLSVRAPYKALTKGANERRNIYANMPRYNALALGAIGTSEGTAEKVLAFHEVLCGCGRDRSVLARTQPAAALLMLARDQRWTEAAGVALSMREFSETAGSVLSLVGVDKRKLMVGEIVVEAASDPSARRRLILPAFFSLITRRRWERDHAEIHLRGRALVQHKRNLGRTEGFVRSVEGFAAGSPGCAEVETKAESRHSFR